MQQQNAMRNELLSTSDSYVDGMIRFEGSGLSTGRDAISDKNSNYDQMSNVEGRGSRGQGSNLADLFLPLLTFFEQTYSSLKNVVRALLQDKLCRTQLW